MSNVKKMILYGWLNSGAQYDLYPSIDQALLLGTGAKAYLAFGGLTIQQSAPYKMCAVYRKGSDHNATPDGDIMAIFSDDGFLTFEDANGVANQATTVTANGGVLYSNPTPFYTSTGRLIVFYSAVYYKYSDDDGVTWSSQQSINASPPPYAGPGECIEVGGILLKVMQDVNGPTGCYLWQSVDDGANWTQRSQMFNPALNFDEATVGRLNNGDLFGMYRDNVTKKLFVNRSLDVGLTWSVPSNTGIDAQAKAPFAISPQGNLFGFARYPVDPFQTIRLSASGDASDISSPGDIDARQSANMYGGIVWNPALSKGIAVWFMEAYGTNHATHTGPNLILRKEFVESQTAVSPPTVLNPNYQSLRDCSQGRFYTTPTIDTTLDVAYNALIQGLSDDGILTLLDGLYMYGLNSASFQNLALINAKFPYATLSTINGSPTYGVNGFGFTRASQFSGSYLSTGHSLALINFTLNNASAFCWVIDNVSGDNRSDFGSGDGSFSTRSNCTMINTRTASDTLIASLNGNGAPPLSVANANSIGFYQVQRLNSTHIHVFKNGVDISGAVASTSTGRSASNLSIGAEAFSGAPGVNPCGRQLFCFGLGSGLSGKELALYNRINTFKTTMGL